MSEPPDLWEQRLPARFREFAIHIRHEPGKGFYARAGGYEPRPRLEDMARDGIVAEVLYPTFGKDMYTDERPPEAAEACATVYNDWMIEFCRESPDRLWGQAEIPLWNIDWAIREMDRCRKAGLVGATIWMVPPPEIPFTSDHYDRFWAAAQDSRTPVSMHINTGFSSYAARSRNAGRGRDQVASLKRSATGHKQVTADALTEIIVSGVLERFPELKVVVAEVEIGWVPFWLSEMDKMSRRHRLPLKPSEYFYRQCYSTFTEDEVGGRLLQWYGQDSFMWSTDYPHVGTGDIWLFSDEVIARTLGHLDQKVQSKVLRDNVARLYGKAVPARMPEPAPDPTLDEWKRNRTLASV
jgi:predicted TIM-barrel fold metal-dependent hydrolase